MKKILIILLVFFNTISVYSDTHTFVLKGKITTIDLGKIKLSYRTFENKKWVLNEIESTILNGKFMFKGYLTEPVESEITINDSIKMKLFIEPTEMNINIYGKKQNKIKLVGSKTHIDYEQLKSKLSKLDSLYEENSKIMRPLYDKLDRLQESDSTFGTLSQKIYFLKKQADTIDTEKLNIIKKFTLAHPNSYYPILSNKVLVYISRHYLSVDSARIIYNRLSEKVKKYSQSMFLDRYLGMRENTQIGKSAPNFIAKDISGKQISLTDFKGNYVLLDFWASHCVPCIQGIPHLKQLYLKYHCNGLDIIGITCEYDKKSWIKGIEKYQLYDWTQVMSVQDIGKAMQGYVNDEDIVEKYPTDGIPKYILIDKSGKIIGKWEGYSVENEKEMDEMLKSIFK